jgi:hypothetical protein
MVQPHAHTHTSRLPRPKGKLQRGRRRRPAAAAAAPEKVNPSHILHPGWPPFPGPAPSGRHRPWQGEVAGIGRIGPGSGEVGDGSHSGRGNRCGAAAAMRSGRERESTREEAQRESGGDWGRGIGGGDMPRLFSRSRESSVAVLWASVLDGPNRFTGDAPVVVKKVLLITVV